MRRGLFVRAHNIHPEVRRSVISFARWMRTQFEFPIRVPVYLSPNAHIVTKNRKRVTLKEIAELMGVGNSQKGQELTRSLEKCLTNRHSATGPKHGIPMCASKKSEPFLSGRMNDSLLKAVGIFLLLSLNSCSKEEGKLATFAVARDFDGKWVGTWSWEPSRSTTIEVSGPKAAITELPTINGRGDQTEVVSGPTTADFQESYGSKGKTYILVSLPDRNEAVALFITKDHKHLVYTADINFDKRIVFKKLPP